MSAECGVASEAKLILITGASSGIGLETCKTLCADGHSVIATVRTHQKGRMTVEAVRSENPLADIVYMILDLSSIKSIKQFVHQLLHEQLKGRYLDVLVNNAGLVVKYNEECRTVSEFDEINYCLASNTAGPLLLTYMLLEHMKTAAEIKGEARIVFVSSAIIFTSQVYLEFQLDDLWMREKHQLQPHELYKLAKVTLMMGMLDMVHEHTNSSAAHGLKINALCPGHVLSTNIWSGESECSRCCLSCVCNSICYCYCQPQTVNQAAEHLTNLILYDQGQAHGYFYWMGSLTEFPPLILNRTNQKYVTKALLTMTLENGNLPPISLQNIADFIVS